LKKLKKTKEIEEKNDKEEIIEEIMKKL